MLVNRVKDPLFLKLIFKDKIVMCSGTLESISDSFGIETPLHVTTLKTLINHKTSAKVVDSSAKEYSSLKSKRISDSGRKVICL